MFRIAARLALAGLLLIFLGCFPDLREKSRRADEENAAPAAPDTAGLRNRQKERDTPGPPRKAKDTLRPRMALVSGR
ncbi:MULTISPECIES: hypothetical protein [unclassified Robiginitalea]|uniref:hypothetical protein n=1 Tax=Robiginitalea TaxID=252306 RepID=UPI00234B0813|nr:MULTISPECIES: hypothetical protein [unclassified Robiginitalea]MDC6354378.1 hypothetical protein [Robiginitalea sp. PM2]MDC6374940.1 hypothetical protein [Robiginitalea sp. SP8]